MHDDFIDYGELIDDAMRIIVKKALERVGKSGLPGKHHFFVSFLTEYPNVTISDALKKKYPEEMTIVLQHQFDDLKVSDKGFEVILSFDNVKEKIVVSFDALVAFADPSVKFGLQFRHIDDFEDADIHEFSILEEELDADEESSLEVNEDGSKKGKKKKRSSKKTNVVDIDSFRKK